tara:strand:- start:350 stop:1021 length:672 start_codon:yes stop_codon:yes gene_type:complete
MAYILNIETSTTNCSVAVSYNGKQISLKEDNNKQYSHAERLHLYIEEVLNTAKINTKNLDAISVSMGPGSYTGLRIGVSAAKGLCFALDVPLIAIPTLDSLSRKIKITEGYIVPLIDARRMEIYTAIFNSNYSCIESTSAKILEHTSYLNYLESGSVNFVGNAIQKTKTIINHKNAVFHEELPSAYQMCEMSFEKFKLKQFEDLAYFEPFYLKDFIAFAKKNI